MKTLEEIKKVSLPACRKFDVARLAAFGSVSRGAGTESSDVDLLVEFRDPDRLPARRFFGLLHQLEDSLGCKVDLLTPASLKNPYFKRQVLQSLVPIYEG